MMKKSILNLGKALNKAEQKSINGGGGRTCRQQGGNTCCQTFPSGFEFCDAGRCKPNGWCLWY